MSHVHEPRRAAPQVARLEAPGVMAAAFSPRGTYLATFQRTRPEAVNTEKNLKARAGPGPDSFGRGCSLVSTRAR